MLVPLLGILFIACENEPEKKAAEPTSTSADADRLPVDILIAQEEELHHDETAIGTMMPYREVSIVSELPQKITRIAFHDGSYVAQGAILYVLNDTDIRAHTPHRTATGWLALRRRARRRKIRFVPAAHSRA